MSSSKVQRTYGSRNQNLKHRTPHSSSTSALTSSPPSTPPPSRSSKRGFAETLSTEEKKTKAPLFSPYKKTKHVGTSTTLKSKSKPPPKSTKKSDQKTLTQLHFNIDRSVLRKCPLCDLSYIKGALDDEALHKAHCLRVQQELEWGREEEKDRMRGTENIVVDVKSCIKLRGMKGKGRIICLPADPGGKLGTKLSALYKVVNTTLSSPELSHNVLQSSKAYLFLVPHDTQKNREKIVGCVIAQRISSAMAVIKKCDALSTDTSSALVLVDSDTGLFCSPELLPTTMGIPRLFVSHSHRRLGIARALLDAAAATFIHGCPLTPDSGQIAFSQPTGMGQKVMENWGRGHIRVYEED
ncbi:N-acetyltransferase ECO1 [Psilocybe cubensis]|uniref:N-acetyltransferase ECO1 n=2 Tax=Psilocybe cubensis TaxID=181762 RepID=A0ACB8GSG0_PSICU|nr:N-acetyltransferase ECO1 [Psilocybe cubensis]KAH9477964.1 N-acetyltransferase ECO1 [Psilocybe cubensis]